MEKQAGSFLFSDHGGSWNEHCIFSGFVYYCEDIIETIEKGKFVNNIHRYYLEGLSWDRDKLK
jgi:hypothetical protein